MNITQNFLNINPFSLKKKDKLEKFLNYINRLTIHHYKNCEIYGKIIKNLKYNEIPEWDSIGHMNLMSGLEEGFGITMDTDDIVDFSSYKKGTEILRKYKIFYL